MKKCLFFAVIFALVFSAGCKEKVEPVAPPPPPPPPPTPKQTEQEFIRGLVSMIPQLEFGKKVEVPVNKNQVVSDEEAFLVSLFPEEFTFPEEKPYLVKYMFPSVVWKEEGGHQLPVVNLQNYFDCAQEGDKFLIIKKSPNPALPYKQSPTLLVETKGGKFLVLDENGDEMPLRSNWGK